MDSCNSTGSMQSSSGGEEELEYNSRPAAAAAAAATHGAVTAPTTISSFLMHNDTHHHHHHHHQHHRNLPPPLPMFDALPNYFEQLTRPPDRHHHSHLFNLDAAVGSDELGVMLPPSSSPSSSANSTAALRLQSHLGYHPGQSQNTAGPTGGVLNPAFPMVSDPPKPAEVHPEGSNNDGVGIPPRRNPKKRSRASRRAPTTVLTTDTSNFRAMVQEFTGIPAPPFVAASSPFQRARLDLFGTNYTGNTSATESSLLPPPPPSYLLRPFAQRLFQSTPPLPTLFVPSTTSSSNNNSTAAVSTSTELLFPLLNNNSDNVNVQNTASSSSMLDFGQTLLKYSSDHDHERDQPEQGHHPQGNLRAGAGTVNDVLEEFGLTRQGDRDRDRDHSFMGLSSSSQNVAVASRSEGMPMESWICSSE